ncbi:hypothetical protein AX15_005166 [Amanita polypyramis BW_CC]|nr:hypothetical protein AX15_005166 [Amanita polypyramis BW_CC]
MCITATDGSLGTDGTKAGFIAWSNGAILTSWSSFVTAFSSFDAVTQAIEAALIWISGNINIHNITLLVDNDAAARAIWDTSQHNLQYVSVNAMHCIREWFVEVRDHSITTSWVPSHVGITENEEVNHLAASFKESKARFRTSSLAHHTKILLNDNNSSWTKEITNRVFLLPTVVSSTLSSTKRNSLRIREGKPSSNSRTTPQN